MIKRCGIRVNGEFKKQWAAEVVPERKPPAIELVALRESIPASAKAKIADVTTMGEAWKLLELEGEFGIILHRRTLDSQANSAAVWNVTDELTLVFASDVIDVLIWNIHADKQVKTLLPANSR